jgi:hypothetical protein
MDFCMKRLRTLKSFQKFKIFQGQSMHCTTLMQSGWTVPLKQVTKSELY